MTSMPDDALVINRAADLPDLLTKAFREADDIWLNQETHDQTFEDICIPLLVAALGVGQPEQQVREGDLEMAAREIRWIVKFEAQHSPSRERMEDTAARIERVLEQAEAALRQAGIEP